MADDTQELELPGEPEEMTIEKLAKMTDQQLLAAFGFLEQLATAKEQIAEMNKLTGDAREKAQDRIEEMFAPKVYPNEFKYIVESAKRQAKKGTGQDELCNCDPCSVL